jgi:anti-sigma factor RsiW
MLSESCNQIAELLVPYSDGELSGDECRRVEAHLAACPECRHELSLLGRSLELARSIWQESAAAVSPVHTGVPWPRLRGHESGSERHAHASVSMAPRWIVAAVSAAAVLLVAATWLLWPSHPDRQSVRNDRKEPPAAAQQLKPDSASPQPELSEAEIVEMIAREGRKARLQASIAILATEPSLKEYKERAERYLAEAYPETAPGGQPAPVVEHRSEEPKS